MNKKENVILIKGFKKNADGTLSCQDFNFGQESEIIGKTFTLDNDNPLVLCENGFHACDGIGKVFGFYDDVKNNAYFKISVKEAYFEDAEKYVFKEFTVNAALELPGNWNTGDGNTGYRNTGYRNTGNCNTGDCNTGDRNTGDWNTGDWNTGDGNTGDRNTGDNNTGYRNLCNFSSGFFGTEEPKATCFGLPTQFTFAEFRDKFWDIITEEPSFDLLMLLPNATEERVKAYLEKYEALKK
jgi:hypothetical protein